MEAVLQAQEKIKKKAKFFCTINTLKTLTLREETAITLSEGATGGEIKP